MKTILITGASTGIGYGMAVRFAEMGYQVFAGVRKENDGEKLKKANPKIQTLILDVTSELDIQKAVLFVADKMIGEFCLVNNAGIAVAGPVEFVDMKNYHQQFDVNFFGLLAVTKAFLPLVRQTAGRVINISSVAGRVSSPFLGPYSASKFAVEAISDSLRRELQPLGCKVIIIEPGPIQTPIWDKGLNAKESTIPVEAEAIYGKPWQNFRKFIGESAKSAVPVEKVLDVMEQALTARTPKHRYLVGRDARLVAFVPMIPSRIIDRILNFRLSK